MKNNLNNFIKKNFYFSLLIFFFFIIIILNFKKIDNVYFEEYFKDLNGKYLYKEKWIKINDEKLDYSWLKKYSFISHGLEVLTSNKKCNIKLDAMTISLYELNFTTVNNTLYILNDQVKCDKILLLKILNKSENNFIIIDIKDDFKKTSNLIIKYAKKNNFLDKLIFQIYKPNDLIIFFKLKNKYSILPGPLITSYKSRRSINYLTKISISNKIKVLTIPISKSKNFHKNKDLFYFTHSIHNCDQFFKSMKNKKISGIYYDPNLQCLK